MRLHVAARLPGGHRTTQLVRFAIGVVSRMHDQFHDLLLEQRNTQGGAQDFFHFR